MGTWRRFGRTRTYREPASLPQFMAVVIPVVLSTSVLTDVGGGEAHHAWLPSVTDLGIAVLLGFLAGALSRRSLAATQLTAAGVRVRQTASLWQSYPWDAIDDVVLRQGWTEDAVLHLRDGADVTLRGLPLNLAEGLAERFADRAPHHDRPPAAPEPAERPSG